MKVEVGDWVTLRGHRRIYEVSEVPEPQNDWERSMPVFKVHGLKTTHAVAHVEKIAPKFWIRKERMR